MVSIPEKMRKLAVRAMADFNMIEEGDKVMACISGGKDSSVMLLILREIQKKAKIKFTVDAVLHDQHIPGVDYRPFKSWMDAQEIPLHVIDEDTYSIVKEKVPDGKTLCGLCARLRRGVLYNYAHANGYTKLALGHHRDDLNETVLLNLFYGGKFASMPPKLWSDDGRNVLIRPLAYVPEEMIIHCARNLQIPSFTCQSCGSDDSFRRVQIKKMLKNLEKDIVGIHGSLLTAQKNVRPSQLMDKALWDFSGKGKKSFDL